MARYVGGALVLLWAIAAGTLGDAALVPAFEDVSEEVGLMSFKELQKRRARFNKYWGSTIADLDRDGHYDMFLSNHGNNPELYFMQPENGTFASRDPSLKGLDLHATAAADLNNDGYLEFVINRGGSNGNEVSGYPIVNVVTGDQSFSRENRAGEAYRDFFGLGAVAQRGRAMMFLDINADGYLDLLLLNQANITKSSREVKRHQVYQNLGWGKFRLRTDTGIERADGAWGQVIDANSDSYPDVLILKWDAIELWLGTGKFRFEDGTELIPEAASMSRVRCAAEIDFDADGDLDLVLARGGVPGLKGRDDYPELILENRDGIFTAVRGSLPDSGAGRDHFHVTVGDFNNDGLMDMYFSVMNGIKTNRKPDWMYLNEGDGRFSLAPPHGTEPTKVRSDGDNANAFDYNLDGRIDLLVGSRNESWRLYENHSRRGSSNHYILVRVGEPRGSTAEFAEWFRRKALGALVKVKCGEKVFLQRVGSPGQSHSQSYMDTLHFGLGDCTWIRRIEIIYPGNVVVKRFGVAVDQLVTIGTYFPCPNGLLGAACDEEMTPCSMKPCRDRTDCETVELVGSACRMQKGFQQPKFSTGKGSRIASSRMRKKNRNGECLKLNCQL